MVLITVDDGVEEERITALIEGLRALAPEIDEIESYAVHRDMGLADGNATIGIIGRFASPEALRAYVDHPAHQAVVTELLRPIATTARLQFSDEEPPS
jgi:hypothetical protein